MMCVGLPGTAKLEASIFFTVFKSINILGSYVGNRQDAREAIAIASAGKVKCVYSTKELDALKGYVHILCSLFLRLCADKSLYLQRLRGHGSWQDRRSYRPQLRLKAFSSFLLDSPSVHILYCIISLHIFHEVVSQHIYPFFLPRTLVFSLFICNITRRILLHS